MAQPVAGTEVKLKGKLSIWLGVLAMIGGVVFGIVLVVQGVVALGRVVDDYQRVPAAGGSLVLVETGRYNVFLERPGASSTYQYSVPGSLLVTDPDGRLVPLSYPTGSLTYDYDGREGRRIATFRAVEPGRYQLRLAQGDGSPPVVGSLAVGSNDLSSLASVAVGVIVGSGLFLIGLLLVIIGAVRRSKSKKRRAAAMGIAPPVWSAAGPIPAAPGTWAPSGGAPPGWAPPPPAPAPYAAPGAWPTAPPAPSPGPAPGPQAPGTPPGWAPVADAPPPLPGPDVPPPLPPADDRGSDAS